MNLRRIASNIIAKMSADKLAIDPGIVRSVISPNFSSREKIDRSILRLNRGLNENSESAITALKDVIVNTKDILEDTGDISEIDGYIVTIQNAFNKIKNRPGMSQLVNMDELSKFIRNVNRAAKNEDMDDMVDAMVAAIVGWDDIEVDLSDLYKL